MNSGYVYILTNKSLPGLIKIGRTERDSNIRAKELQGTGVPTPFKIAFEVFCEDQVALEKAVHEDLDEYRVSANREFFKIDVDSAISTLRRLYKPSPEDSYLALDFTYELQHKYPDYIKPEIVSIRLVQSDSHVWLEINIEKEIAGYLVDQKIHRSDLAFISGENDTKYFSPDNDISINLRKFIDGYDSYSIIMTTDLFHHEACKLIEAEYKQKNA